MKDGRNISTGAGEGSAVILNGDIAGQTARRTVSELDSRRYKEKMANKANHEKYMLELQNKLDDIYFKDQKHFSAQMDEIYKTGSGIVADGGNPYNDLDWLQKTTKFRTDVSRSAADRNQIEKGIGLVNKNGKSFYTDESIGLFDNYMVDWENRRDQTFPLFDIVEEQEPLKIGGFDSYEKFLDSLGEKTVTNPETASENGIITSIDTVAPDMDSIRQQAVTASMRPNVVEEIRQRMGGVGSDTYETYSVKGMENNLTPEQAFLADDLASLIDTKQSISRSRDSVFANDRKHKQSIERSDRKAAQKKSNKGATPQQKRVTALDLLESIERGPVEMFSVSPDLGVFQTNDGTTEALAGYRVSEFDKEGNGVFGEDNKPFEVVIEKVYRDSNGMYVARSRNGDLSYFTNKEAFLNELELKNKNILDELPTVMSGKSVDDDIDTISRFKQQTNKP